MLHSRFGLMLLKSFFAGISIHCWSVVVSSIYLVPSFSFRGAGGGEVCDLGLLFQHSEEIGLRIFGLLPVFLLVIALSCAGRPLERTLGRVLGWTAHIGCFTLTPSCLRCISAGTIQRAGACIVFHRCLRAENKHIRFALPPALRSFGLLTTVSVAEDFVNLSTQSNIDRKSRRASPGRVLAEWG